VPDLLAMIPAMTSPVSYLTDEAYAALPVEVRALHQARSQDAVREATGKNDGKVVAAFLAAAGLRIRAPWCAAFVFWCLKKAGWKEKGPEHPASTWWWADWAKRQGRLIKDPRKVRRGMLFVWNRNGKGHIGFVLSEPDSKGRFRTLEGNTNSQGGREGNGVFGRTRTVAELKRYPIWGFIDVSEVG